MGRGGTYPTMQDGSFTWFACKYDRDTGADMGKGNVCHN